MLSLQVGQRLTESLTQKLSPTLKQSVGETSGDIPLYSLHRIKNKLARKDSILVSPEIKTLLMRNLIAANKMYKKESGNDWSCLTSANLVDAIELIDGAIEATIEGLEDIPKEYTSCKEAFLRALHSSRKKNVKIIQSWFEDNFDDLLYDMRGNIPWAIVCRLRRNLSRWIVGVSNPFLEDIEEMVLDVSIEEGLNTDDPEEAWEKMGGKVFKKKEKK